MPSRKSACRCIRETRKYMVQHALDRATRWLASAGSAAWAKLTSSKGRITVVPRYERRGVIQKASQGATGARRAGSLGVHQYSSGTAQAVLDQRASGRAPHILLRLAYYAGWPGRVLGRTFKTAVKRFGWVARMLRVAEIDDQVERAASVASDPVEVVRGRRP